MRALKDTVSLIIDPWAFARNRQILTKDLLLKHTQALQEWTGNDQDSVSFAISGSIDEQGRPRLAGHLAVTLHAECQRCLEKMDFPVNHDFDYVLIRHLDQENNVTDGSETFICEGEELDLIWFIEEEILLAMPMIAKHDNCGLPQIDSLLEEKERKPAHQNPFADLKKMIETQETPHGRSTKS